MRSLCCAAIAAARFIALSMALGAVGPLAHGANLQISPV